MQNLEIDKLLNFKERSVGLEFENPVIKKDGETILFPEIQEVWRTFERYDWEGRHDSVMKEVIDGIGKDFDGERANVISDSGAGNFELALSPQENVGEAEKMYRTVLKEILSVLKERGLTLAGFAVQPGIIKDIEAHRRKNAMYLALHELGASDVYCNQTTSAISAHQVGAGMKLEEFINFTNELIKITGLIVALCGNSPIQNWKILPWKEWRIHCVGYFRFVGNISGFERLSGFPTRPFNSIADFFRYYWSVPYMILPPQRDSFWVIPDQKMNFIRYFSQDEIPAHNFYKEKIILKPNAEDINLASISMWPHAKPHITVDPNKVNIRDFNESFKNNSLEEYLEGKLTNCYIECRAAAAAPVGEEMALPALMLGIVNNMAQLKELTKKYTWEEWARLVFDASVHGIKAKVRNEEILPLLSELHNISKEGLEKRKFGEEKYLDIIRRRIETQCNPADTAIKHFKESKSSFIDYISYR